MALLFVLPLVLIGNDVTVPRGDLRKLAGFALYASPLTGYLLLALASRRNERAVPLRWVFVVLYVLWLIGDAVIFVWGGLFGMGRWS